MARTLSLDLRERVVAAVEGGMSRRQAAKRFGVSIGSAVRWCARPEASRLSNGVGRGPGLESKKLSPPRITWVWRDDLDAPLNYPLIYVIPKAPVNVAFWRMSCAYRSTSGRRRSSGMLGMRS
jgi:hypothetical protein